MVTLKSLSYLAFFYTHFMQLQRLQTADKSGSVTYITDCCKIYFKIRHNADVMVTLIKKNLTLEYFFINTVFYSIETSSSCR